MKVVVLGGDGFCGWPTALHLSMQGHEVVILDNLSRRNIDNELEVQSLTPIQSISIRLEAWHEVTGKTITYQRLDVATEYDRLLQLISDLQPDSIVHFAEQRAAPYSMKSSWHKRYTVNNNLNSTNNVLAAIVECGLDIDLKAMIATAVEAQPQGKTDPEEICAALYSFISERRMTAQKSNRRFCIRPTQAASIT